MTFAELKKAVLKIKAAVEARDPLAAFGAFGEFSKLLGDFFGVTVFATDDAGKADLGASLADLKAACDECDADPKVAADAAALGPWAGLLFEAVRLFLDRILKK